MINIRNMFTGLLLLVSLHGFSQNQKVIDQVIAVVGDEPILLSEVETQAMQLKSQGYFGTTDVNCEILEEMLFQKLLLQQAKKDSIEVTSAEVENELDRRLNMFIRQLGSEQKLEEYYQKTLPEIKSDFREMIKEQMLTQRMQQKLTNDINVTPAEVRQHFNSIREDSIPVVPATYRIKQIAIYPKVSEKEKQRCLDKINELRDRIIDGENFSTLAVLYSDDPGSAQKGGELGFVNRTDLVPEFASIAFDMDEDDPVSRVVETEFGYHILKLIERKGNQVNVRHILVSPKTGSEAQQQAKEELRNIRAQILSDSLGFEKSAEMYSEDENTKNSGGTVMNPQTGETKLEASDLDPLVRSDIENLDEGEISDVIRTRDERGKTVYKLFKLDEKTEKHTANLKQDYQRYKDITLNKKKEKVIQKWMKDQLKQTYVRIEPAYQNCEFQYTDWTQMSGDESE
ncbi:MAG: peptidylprolyl isomerase [Bacteroidota bacterium]|nr:peptidylprolyl isomerase [Bacteroidota bacterium]